MIGFGLQSATKLLKIGLQTAMRLQSATSLHYKLWQYYKAWCKLQSDKYNNYCILLGKSKI